MADYLNNVALLDAYDPTTQLGPAAQYDHASIIVANNPALMQFFQRSPGASPLTSVGGPAQVVTDEREYLVTPQSFIVRNITGFRARNANAGAVARCIAVLSGKADVQFETGQPFTATLKASGAVTQIGAELAYNEFTAPVTLAGTTEAAATIIVTADAVTSDGATPLNIEISVPRLRNGNAADTPTLVLDMDGASIGRFGSSNVQPGAGGAIGPVFAMRRVIAPSGSHSFSLRGFSSDGTGVADAGAGASGNFLPGFIRITQGG